MAGRSFIEILEARIRNDIRKELLAEMAAGAPVSSNARAREEAQAATAAEARAAAEAAELWLLNALKGPLSAAKPCSAKAFRFAAGLSERVPSNPACEEIAPETSPWASVEPSAASEPSYRLDSGPAIIAREIFRRMGEELPERCTIALIKATFRKLALRHHPDHHEHAGPAAAKHAAESFAALADAYQTLLATCGPTQAKG